MNSWKDRSIYIFFLPDYHVNAKKMTSSQKKLFRSDYITLYFVELKTIKNRMYVFLKT